MNRYAALAHASADGREQRVPIELIHIGDRRRRDMGDLEALAASIADLGLIQPIVVTGDLRLIVGERRVAACRRLGWTDIPAMVSSRLVDAAAWLRAQRDEHTCHKPMTPSELVALGLQLEALERPKGRERMAQAGRSAAPGRPAQSPLHRTRAYKTDDVVGGALGMGGSNYHRARALVRAAEDGDARAAEAVAQMDRTGKITPAYNEFTGRPSAPSGHAPAVHAPPAEIRPPRRQQQRPDREVIAAAMSTLRGLTLGLEQVNVDVSVTWEEAASWERDLCRALRVLRSVHTKLKEHAHGS